jgi:hypothetical protein
VLNTAVAVYKPAGSDDTLNAANHRLLKLYPVLPSLQELSVSDNGPKATQGDHGRCELCTVREQRHSLRHRLCANTTLGERSWLDGRCGPTACWLKLTNAPAANRYHVGTRMATMRYHW